MGSYSDEASQLLQRLAEGDFPDTVVRRGLDRHPERVQGYAAEHERELLRGLRWALAYLGSAVDAGEPALFMSSMAWLKSLLVGAGVPLPVAVDSLETLRQLLLEQLPEGLRETTDDYLKAGLGQLRAAPVEPPSFLQAEAPLSDLARQYLSLLLAGNRHLAANSILQAVREGVSVKDVYLRVLQPVQQEIGRLWQLSRIGVAQEHFCTAVTQAVMSQLYPIMFTGQTSGPRLVATCVGGELHEIGLRMVSDFLEMEGWDTYFLGANMPTQSVLEALADRQAQVLAISTTMTYHLGATARLIEVARSSALGAALKILVGGYPFNLAPNLWRVVGADAYARDAEEALTVASDLCRGKGEEGGGRQ